jgi:hypothetical protein
MKPRPPFLSVQRWCALCLLAICLSVSGPAQAQSYEPPRPEARDTHLEESRLIATEGHTVSEISQTRRVLSTVGFSALGGVLGLPIGFMVGLGLCELTNSGNETFGCELEGVAGAILGGVIGIPIVGIIAWRQSSGGDTQVSIVPYRHDDASGLMFSGQF